ncbi:MAG TPA: TonB family protein [Candidatus Sulfotelmatobacter sp.]|nr:TonB family protein [Candidatus Sulfotelmatobacter sp.]
MPRFLVQAQVDLTVLRSGVPDTVPGRSVNVCERGVAAIIAGELVTGESVGVELHLRPLAEPLRTRALVRYQDKLRCGLEFVALSAEQRASIRDWAREARAIAEDPSVSVTANPLEQRENEPRKSSDARISAKPPSRAKRKRRGWWLVGLFLLLSAAICWWRWNRGWEALEFGLRSAQADTVEKPRAQVAAEVMEKLLVHRVEPVYPAEARKQGLEGTIALDIVVGRDGAVLRMHALNGPDVLARAAMDALRWWKFEPYRINGEPAVVETTVAVEFKR